MNRLLTVLLSFMLINGSLFAQDLAATPPMGWNSWDSYGRTITEQNVRDTAKWMADHLKQHGWQYVVVDEGWYIPNPEADPKQYTFSLGPDGRYVPTVNRFPSAKENAGMKPLADYVHSLGLKFGIHIIRGIPREAVQKNLPIADSNFHAADAADTSDTCPWNAYNYGVKDNPAGQAYYNSLAKLYAGWGVDFLKIDCIGDHPYKPAEIRMVSTALRGSGRNIVLSLSPGPTAVEHAGEVAEYANMWRISDDFWDHWGPWKGHEWSQGLLQQFASLAKWAPYTRRGHWPDADMLPLGHLGPHPGEGDPRDTQFTRDEQRTLITLWSIARSPLIMGGDLLSADEWLTSLLANDEVLAVDQHSSSNQPILQTEKTVVWRAAAEGHDGRYVAVFNISDAQQSLSYSWKELGIGGSSLKARDLWEHKDLAPADHLSTTLAPHASALYYVSAAK